MYKEISIATLETLLMVGVSGLFSILLGLPLGILLYGSQKGRFWANTWAYRLLSFAVNVGRSIPFIILFIAIMPFTKFLVHKTIGIPAAIVALTVAAIPFYARVVEMALNEVPNGIIEAAYAMGASHGQMIAKVLLPESLVGLIRGLTLTLVNLIGYSAMTGFTGTGGLGAMAINYGYNRYDTQIIILTVVIMVALVQLIQLCGEYASSALSYR